jgi:transcriptional regulator with XRE-family HTH domain
MDRSTLTYHVRVAAPSFAESLRRVPVRFPPTASSQGRDIGLVHTVFENPKDEHPSFPEPLSRFELVAVLHSGFAEHWPIPVDAALAVRGFRRAIGLSQVAFAERLGQSRVTVERWEAGTSRPFRGAAHPLLSALRPMVDGPVAAGQLLGVAALAVLPTLTRPAATYTRRQVAAALVAQRHDHSDLGPALIQALVQAEILVEVDPSSTDDDAELIPRAGIAVLDRASSPWDSRALALAARLSDDDARMWLALGERLAADGARPS